MSITISFQGNNAAELRAEALAFFNAKPTEQVTAAPATTATPATDDKDALVERAKELGIDANKRWGVPKLEAAIAEAEATGSEPEPEDPFALDADPEPETTATKEDVRDALVGYQTALRDSLIKKGTAEDEAKTKAMTTARDLLKTEGGADTLGGLDEAKYGVVVAAAKAAIAKL